jgi:hypothetical protein
MDAGKASGDIWKTEVYIASKNNMIGFKKIHSIFASWIGSVLRKEAIHECKKIL